MRGMLKNNDEEAPEGLPDPSPEMSLLTALVEAYISTRPRKEALAFLRTVAEVFRSREDFATSVVDIRKGERERLCKQTRANRQARAEFRRLLDRCVSRLNLEDDDEE